MKVSRIYEKYKVMPQLQTHMLRVTGVARIICDSFSKPIDKDTIISACLLHDMGSMSKINLGIFPEHAAGKGMAYWEKVQNEFIKNYGKDDHKAAVKICKELVVSSEVTDLVRQFGFKNTKKIFKNQSLEVKICVYSDMRVSPFGITSLEERLEEAKQRYLGRMTGIYTHKQFQEFIPVWKTIEEQIFYNCNIKPKDITDRKVMPMLIKLTQFNIKTK